MPKYAEDVMPRPSLKDQRSAEILDAYLTCVSRFGLEGATQDRIAAEAGVKRPLLRHYLGNRDQMVGALAEYVVAQFAISTDQLGAALQVAEQPQDIVELLFADPQANDPRLMLAWQALTATAPEHSQMRAPLLGSLDRFLQVLEACLSRTAPQAPQAHLRAVAQGIGAAYVNLDAISPLAPPAVWHSELKQAASLLAASLETTK